MIALREAAAAFGADRISLAGPAAPAEHRIIVEFTAAENGNGGLHARMRAPRPDLTDARPTGGMPGIVVPLTRMTVRRRQKAAPALHHPRSQGDRP